MDHSSQPEATLALRPRLLAVAYRMLGTVTDAEDAVQDAYLRLQTADNVIDPEAWMVKTTTHVCIDRLRQRQRQKQYHGPWLPEPVSGDWAGAQQFDDHLAESLSMAFLLLLETLSPSERAAFLLREVLGYDFNEIARLLETTPVNTRQLTARARKRLTSKDRRFVPAQRDADQLSERFFEACRTGDMAQIEQLLAQDAILYADGGGKAHAAPQPITGAGRIAKLMSVAFRKLQGGGELSLTTVNGHPGIVITVDGRIEQIVTCAASGGRIDSLFVVRNPDKLRHWPLPGLGR